MNYWAITKDDMLNGEGLRVVLWIAGCNHHCEGCHNPYTWDINGGKKFWHEAYEELCEALEKEHTQGLTLSGGDPFHPENRYEVGQLCKLIKQAYPDKDIWIYTGYKFDEIKHLKAMEYADVLVDGEFVKDLADIDCEWRGSTNQNIYKKEEGEWRILNK